MLKRLHVVLRADTLGSLEAIVESLQKLTQEEIRVDVIKQGLGNITEKDIVLAESPRAVIFGFHTGLTPGAEQAARNSGTKIQNFSIIYELIDAVKKEMEQLLDPETVFSKTGKIRLLANFKAGAHYQIVGGKVLSGTIQNTSPVKVYRDGKMIGEGLITQLQAEKKNVSSVTTGTECGIRFETTVPLQEGDEFEVYTTEKKARSLEGM